jgi:hypothetical protein
MVRLYDFRDFELPVFDAKSGLEIVKSTFPDDNILLHCRDINGASVQLRDFDSAGAKDRYYYTWLKILNVPNTEFISQNPLASGQINRYEK